MSGQLRGMFDGPTSEAIRFNSPMVVLDIAETGGRSGMERFAGGVAAPRALSISSPRAGSALLGQLCGAFVAADSY